MTITFNVKDELGLNFISASRWKIDRPDLNDDTIVKKSIKAYMGTLVDAYARYLAVGTDETTLAALQTQFQSLDQQIRGVSTQLAQKKVDFAATYTPVDPDAP